MSYFSSFSIIECILKEKKKLEHILVYDPTYKCFSLREKNVFLFKPSPPLTKANSVTCREGLESQTGGI